MKKIFYPLLFPIVIGISYLFLGSCVSLSRIGSKHLDTIHLVGGIFLHLFIIVGIGYVLYRFSRDKKLRIIAIISFFIFLSIRLSFTFSNSQSKDTPTQDSTVTLEQALANASSEMNKNLPKMLSKDVQATSTSSNGKVLVYNYKITNSSVQFSQNDLDIIKSEVIKLNCTESSMKYYLDQGAEFNYAYYDNNSKIISSFSIYASDCK